MLVHKKQTSHLFEVPVCSGKVTEGCIKEMDPGFRLCKDGKGKQK